ncbi:hypothetical protein BY458DRAFT_152698 [Sporodiniella umbellata]|nr:hypothetical protein BY458DRAFT_152698 [Sporodiniella umbellata]
MMVTQSLLQDIDLNTTSSLHRSQALRALGSITKVSKSMFLLLLLIFLCLQTADLHSLERIMKAAIVDPHPWVRSAVIVAIDHHLDSAPEKVRRWSSWLQEAIYSPPSAPFAWFQALPDLGLAQYHGLGLLSRIRWTDPMALTKLVHYYAQKESHPLTLCHWIRCARQVMEHQPK